MTSAAFGGDILLDKWHTWEWKPRLHCSTLRRNTANSRVNPKERGQELRRRYQEGGWAPHLAALSPEERRELAVEAGTASAETQRPRVPARVWNSSERRLLRSAFRKRHRREALTRRRPNERLRAARRAAGLSHAQPAAVLGVHSVTVGDWERWGYEPRDPEMRHKVEALLGEVFGEEEAPTGK